MEGITVHFMFYRIEDGRHVASHEDTLRLDVSATYEEIIELLMRRRFLLQLTPPFRYTLVLKRPAMGVGKMEPGLPAERSVTLREGETLANMRLGTRDRDVLECAIFLETEASPLAKLKPSRRSPGWSEALTTVATAATHALILTAGEATILQMLVVVEEWWSKRHSARDVSSPPRSSQRSEPDILAIRLQMTDGTGATFQEWLTDPARLKRFIDTFLQPSASVKPLQVVFVLMQSKTIVVDVSKGEQRSLQLNELLSYLNTNSAEQ